jgi:uracil-DNA glycosylase family 4
MGEAPGKHEIVKGEPFVGKSGFALHQWLIRAVPRLQLAVERGDVTVANTLRCLPPEIQGRPYPKGQEKLDAEAHCRQYDHLTEQIRTVVCFGESPQRLFFRDELEAEDLVDRKLGHAVKGVAGRMGRVYERDGKRWIFAPHPAWILRQPSLVEHGQACLKIAAGTDKEVSVDYVGWAQAVDAAVLEGGPA